MTSFKLDKEDSIQQRKLLISFGQALAAKGASVVLAEFSKPLVGR